MTKDYYQRPTSIDVNLDALVGNFNKIQKNVGKAQVMPILKANAYGCGIIPCARALAASGATSFGVALLQEAVDLRVAGITEPILVLGGILVGDQIDHYLEFDLDMTASSVYKLKAIDERAKALGKRAMVHLKIDTGFERIGTHYYTADSLLNAALETTHCDIRGIYSHFADLDDSDVSYAELQLSRFKQALSSAPNTFIDNIPLHIAASPGTLLFPESHLDLVRPGLALYGVLPTGIKTNSLGLEPVLSLRSTVVYFKVTHKDAGVSYGLTWHAPEDTRIVTIPIGYGDGYLRALSNRSEVLIRGNRYPVVGNICMDQLMVNIGPSGTAYNGDEVVLIGTQGDSQVTVEELAAILDTTPHEVLVTLNQRIPRTYHWKGNMVNEDLESL